MRAARTLSDTQAILLMAVPLEWTPAKISSHMNIQMHERRGYIEVRRDPVIEWRITHEGIKVLADWFDSNKGDYA